jgi:hypothetical protein
VGRSAKERSIADPRWKTPACECGPLLLTAPEGLHSFPQKQDSTDPKLYAVIRRAQKLVSNVRGPSIGRPHPGQSSRRRS